MVSIAEWVDDLGGMAQKQQLVRRGARDHHLTAAVRSGEVVRARNGWYSTMREDDARLRAVRVGGRLTGLSAVESWGGWVLNPPLLHVSVHENAARLRTQWNRHKKLDVGNPRGVALHWDSPRVNDFGTATTVGVADALECVVLTEPFEEAVAALDWALHTRVLDRVDFESLVLRLPSERQGIADWVDERCESLPESLARTRLRLADWEVETQVPLGELQSIDIVVEGEVAVEVDGEAHHLGRFEYDRGKDIDITIDHRHVIRPSARAVFHDWPRVQLAIETALHDRGVLPGNSGHLRGQRRSGRGLAGWRRRPPRRNPEFPKGAGAVGAMGGAGAAGGTGAAEGAGGRSSHASGPTRPRARPLAQE